MILTIPLAIRTGGSGNPDAEIQVPEGKRARILSAFCLIATPGLDGDQCIAVITRSGTQLANCPSNCMSAAETRVTFGIGLTAPTRLIATIDPVTGIVVYIQSPIASSGALPDAWFPWTIVIELQISGPAGAMGEGTIVYEIVDDWPRARTPKRERK